MAAPAIHARCDMASGRRLESLSFLSLSPAVPARTDLIHGASHCRNALFEAILFFFSEKGEGKKRGKDEKIICSADYIIACQDAALNLPPLCSHMLWETFTLVFDCWSQTAAKASGTKAPVPGTFNAPKSPCSDEKCSNGKKKEKPWHCLYCMIAEV